MIPDVIATTTKVDATPKTKNLDDKSKQKLQKAVQDFEAIFVNYMLQNMRKTVQKSDDEDSGFGGDMMQGMFDLEISKHVAKSSNLGMGEMLYKQLTGESLPQQAPRHYQAPSPVSVPDNVRVAVPAPAAPPTQALSQEKGVVSLPKKMDQLQTIIDTASTKYDVDPNLIKAVIAAESAGNPRAMSSKSAKGLMQLIDSTATAMGVKDVWNPQQNVNGGSKYLRQLLDRFDGDVKLAVASYNAGPEAVAKHNGVPPYPETTNYVKRVLKYKQLFDQQGGDDQ
ncbi:MAG TPA: transglycosylase SLT domain-containing protein [Bacteroidota bacterium]|nr:transglycosylase SLT domain-containing protein [Bacteroidota bacterium]